MVVFAFNSPAKIGGWVGKQLENAPGPVKIIVAPVTAPANVVSDLVEGKPPSVGQAVEALSPTAAQLAETGRQVGASNLGQLPKNANEAAKSGKRAADNANVAINEVRELFPGFKATLNQLSADAGATRQNIAKFLTMVAVPAQFLLWALTFLVVAKLYRFMVPKRVGTTPVLKNSFP